MTMTPYNGDLTQALKWLQNDAPNIQSLIDQKASWYAQFDTAFWTNWQENVFNLQTANSFGLMVWCIILGVPSQLFGLYPLNDSFAYGAFRQNYVYSGEGYAITDPNMTGGNFYGGGNTTVINLNEVRWALQLRYAALVSNGRLSFINRMLNFIFNGGQPWSFSNKQYFYVADSTVAGMDISVANIYENQDWQGNTLMFSAPRTNFQLYSQALETASAWTPTNVTVVPAAVAAPDGTMTGEHLTDSAVTAGYHNVSSAVEAVMSGAATASIFALQAERTFLTLRLMDGDSGETGNYCYATFDLATGTFSAGNVGTASGAMASMVPTPSGWWKCSISGTPSISYTGIKMLISAPLTQTNGTSYTGVPGDGIYVWGTQLGEGTAVGRYLMTTAATVTAPADYTLNMATGQVTFAVAPIMAAILSWTGTWGSEVISTPQQFGTGDNVTTTFQVPVGAAIPPITKPNYLEYRVGANMGLSSGFINLLNSPQYGITPCGAGSSYLVVQET